MTIESRSVIDSRTWSADQEADPPKSTGTGRRLRARYSPWTTFCEGIPDIEGGYEFYPKLYKRNYGPHLPHDKNSKLLIISAGPGYFVKFLNDLGYADVLGVDSDPQQVKIAMEHGINVIEADAIQHLEESMDVYDMVVLEQEINHLTRDEFMYVLGLVKARLTPGGSVALNAYNTANPITAPDHIATNLDHYSFWTSLSLGQAFHHSGYKEYATYPLDNYVLYSNPLNYVAKFATGLISILLRVVFKMYGKDEKIFSKRLVSVGKVA